MSKQFTITLHVKLDEIRPGALFDPPRLVQVKGTIVGDISCDKILNLSTALNTDAYVLMGKVEGDRYISYSLHHAVREMADALLKTGTPA